jgi:hypothetical protein
VRFPQGGSELSHEAWSAIVTTFPVEATLPPIGPIEGVGGKLHVGRHAGK